MTLQEQIELCKSRANICTTGYGPIEKEKADIVKEENKRLADWLEELRVLKDFAIPDVISLLENGHIESAIEMLKEEIKEN